MKKGFTLVEILVAVMIVAILVTMAVPLYDKTIEKSRMAEARTVLKQLLDSKLRVLDAMDRDSFRSGLFGFENLDFSLPCESSETDRYGHIYSCTTKDFKFVLLPSASGVSGSSAQIKNAVCAVRIKGDNKGVSFLYLGELETDSSRSPFLCNSGSFGGSCEAFGLDSTGTVAWCSL